MLCVVHRKIPGYSNSYDSLRRREEEEEGKRERNCLQRDPDLLVTQRSNTTSKPSSWEEVEHQFPGSWFSSSCMYSVSLHLLLSFLTYTVTYTVRIHTTATQSLYENHVHTTGLFDASSQASLLQALTSFYSPTAWDSCYATIIRQWKAKMYERRIQRKYSELDNQMISNKNGTSCKGLKWCLTRVHIKCRLVLESSASFTVWRKEKEPQRISIDRY